MTTMVMLVKNGNYQTFTTMAMIASGAVASDIEVKIFAMEDAVYALQKDKYKENLTFESKYEGYNKALQEASDSGKMTPWWDLMEDLKELGDIELNVCALVADLIGLEEGDFAPVVDGIQEVAAFAGDAEEADIFITL